MLTTETEPTIHTIDLTREIEITAPIDITFQSLLAELGPEGAMPTEEGGTRPFPMVIEPWPGGRWYRDLGNRAGHLWGHVQVIKPPTLLELCGPLFMSYPAVNFVQYRLIREGERTRLRLTHRAFGHIPEDDRRGVAQGWTFGLNRVREIAERRSSR